LDEEVLVSIADGLDSISFSNCRALASSVSKDDDEDGAAISPVEELMLFEMVGEADGFEDGSTVRVRYLFCSRFLFKNRINHIATNA